MGSGNRMLQLKRFWVLVIQTFAIVIILSLIPFRGYQIMVPGEAINIRPFISIEGKNKSPGFDIEINGSLYFTTVIVANANLLTSLYAVFTPWTEILYSEDPAINLDAEREEGLNMMRESKMIATFVALKKAGYDVNIQGEGVNVLDVLRVSHASKILQKGDVIVEIDGCKSMTREDLLATLADKHPGDEVKVVFFRKGEKLRGVIKTIRSWKWEQQRAILGINASTRNMKLNSPIKINIESYDIQGSSAGLMITLGILEQLKKADFTKRFRIAGTGTITIDGTVGEIGGVRQKVVAARLSGAQIFFVPEGNKDEAMKSAVGIRIVPVKSIDDALEFLNKLP